MPNRTFILSLSAPVSSRYYPQPCKKGRQTDPSALDKTLEALLNDTHTTQHMYITGPVGSRPALRQLWTR